MLFARLPEGVILYFIFVNHVFCAKFAASKAAHTSYTRGLKCTLSAVKLAGTICVKLNTSST